MPKKSQRTRTDAPPPLTNRDHLERANFALQASVFFQQLGESSGSGKGKARAVSTSNAEADYERLAQNEMRAFRKWTVHNLVKLDPSIKRAICACNAVLVPGLGASVRVRPSSTHGNVVHTTCACGRKHTLPAAPEAASELDGPVRSERRARKMRQVPFHRRERVIVDRVDSATGEEGAEGAKGVKKGKGGKSGEGVGDQGTGHVLWRGDVRVTGWGVEAVHVDASISHGPASASPPQKRQVIKAQPQKARVQRTEERTTASLTPEELEEMEMCM